MPSGIWNLFDVLGVCLDLIVQVWVNTGIGAPRLVQVSLYWTSNRVTGIGALS